MNCTVRHAERVPALLYLLVIVLLGALLKPAPLHTAAVGSVRGVVHDSQERPVAGADVKYVVHTSEYWTPYIDRDEDNDLSSGESVSEGDTSGQRREEESSGAPSSRHELPRRGSASDFVST